MRLVVFDVGSVLVRAGRTLRDDIEQAGFSVARPWLEQFEQRLAQLPRRTIGAIDSERFFALFAEASAGVFTTDDARRITDASMIAEYPGIARVFDAADAAGFARGLLGNVNDREWDRLFPPADPAPEFPTLARARHRFASHLLGMAKPNPDVYRAVERATGYAGESVLFFDDRHENVEAARGIGWSAEMIEHSGDTAQQLLVHLSRHGIPG